MLYRTVALEMLAGVAGASAANIVIVIDVISGLYRAQPVCHLGGWEAPKKNPFLPPCFTKKVCTSTKIVSH